MEPSMIDSLENPVTIKVQYRYLVS